MKRLVLALILFTVSTPAFAEDCPVKHLALTGLDHASMEAAVRASFVGLYHRAPSGIPGSGPDDIGWWIATFDHYGAYGDNVCRAGWNAYAELRLSGAASGDPALGDQPARFQPEPTPPVVTPPPSPPVVIPPAPVVDTTAVLVAIADLKATMQAEHAEQTNALKSLGHFIADNWPVIAASLGAYLVGHQGGK
jgi:hypothetical protein